MKIQNFFIHDLSMQIITYQATISIIRIPIVKNIYHSENHRKAC